MNNKIYPCFWHDGTAKEAAELYIKALGNGRIKSEGMVVDFELFGQRFIGLNGGPMYSMNPSISMFVIFDNEKDIEHAWQTLMEGGKTLMTYDTYPCA